MCIVNIFVPYSTTSTVTCFVDTLLLNIQCTYGWLTRINEIMIAFTISNPVIQYILSFQYVGGVLAGFSFI